MGIKVIAFVSNLVFGEIITIYSSEDHYPVGLFKTFKEEASWEV